MDGQVSRKRELWVNVCWSGDLILDTEKNQSFRLERIEEYTHVHSRKSIIT